MRLRHAALLAFTALLVAPAAASAQDDPVTVRPAAFENAGAALAGGLYLPGSAPVGGVVLVHGAGPTRRMERTAALFTARGFAVVAYDKRGVGESGGEYEAERNTSPENLALLAGDAAAAMDWLAAQPGMEDLPLGYWGISQAGWIIPLAALDTPQADFVVLWSGPVCTVTEEMEAGIGRGGNLSSDEDARAFIDSLRAQGADTDPRDALRMLDIPGLWIFGGMDDTLPVDLSIERLQGLIDAGSSNFEYRLSQEGVHNLELPADRQRVDDMIDWMLARQNVN